MRPAILVAALASSLAHGHPQSNITNWAEEIWDDIQETITCAGCQGLLGTLKIVAKLGENTLTNVLTDVCIISGVVDPDVCEGFIAAEGTAAHYVLSNLKIGSRTADAFCAHVVGLCDYPAVQPFNLTFPVASSNATRPPPSGQQPIRVAHISDTHVDHGYTPGSNAHCSKPICCRSYTPEDAPGNTSSPCGLWGDAHCDPPVRLEDNMMAAIREQDPAFAIFTGDIVAHDMWLVNQSSVTYDLHSTNDNLGSLGCPVFAALGNHDTHPVNLFPSTDVPASHNPQWVYDTLASDWSTLIPSSSPVRTTPYGSYSTLHPNGHLRIISYNSIFYYKYNFYVFEEPLSPDPSHQLQWLITELQAAESAHERVWLVAHIPTGGPDTLHDYSHAFDAIINRYAATIAALFNGHTHTDNFQLSYSDYAEPTADSATAIAYIAPSMAPTSGPPAFRIYDIDPVTFAVLDYTMYIANITASLAAANSQPNWTKYYSAKEAYGAKLTPPVTDPAVELTPAFWHRVTEKMEEDVAEFDAYWERTTRGYNVTECVGDCAVEEICGLRAGDAQHRCSPPGGGLGLRKRDGSGAALTEARPARPECDDGGFLRVFGEAVRRVPDLQGYIRRRAEVHAKSRG
ncbi:Sphingomyelin phosphodiesterase [Aspergillus nanangensis]|uniref:Sphingomyelin phosphodiesterase n=1 Tax=Aspergillus nanangensis TaxID=2582783 RepID=A0AAD4GTW1_ASPNN|nr:Sphingomyelin phosphodiesterase [Aspergillus nanangensis]